MTRDWQPSITADGGYRRKSTEMPHPGQVIAYYDRKAWRVIEVGDVAQPNWSKQTVRAWEKAGRPDPVTWPERERRVFAEPARNPLPSGKDRRGLGIYPWAWNVHWWPLQDPYPVCVDCGLLWPCPCDDRNEAAAAAMAELDRLGAVLPGCCWGCGEPVTSRQHSIEFIGENLLMPGAGPALFHISHSRKAARGPSGNQTCRGDAEKYEQQWVAADRTRKARLTCPGATFRHFGYSECTTLADCPGENATHADFSHCTTAHYTIEGVQAVPLTSCGERGCRGPKVPVDDTTPLTTDVPA